MMFDSLINDSLVLVLLLNQTKSLDLNQIINSLIIELLLN